MGSHPGDELEAFVEIGDEAREETVGGGFVAVEDLALQKFIGDRALAGKHFFELGVNLVAAGLEHGALVVSHRLEVRAAEFEFAGGNGIGLDALLFERTGPVFEVLIDADAADVRAARGVEFIALAGEPEGAGATL